MRRVINYLLLIVLTASTFAHGQTNDRHTYFGIGADMIIANASTTSVNNCLFIPAPSLQFGSSVSPQFEVRGAFATLIYVSVVSADALYTNHFSNPSLRYYLGGGPDLALILPILADETSSLRYFALHLTAGLEYRASSVIGLYAESQPFIIFSTNITPGVRLRTGVNFHF